MYLKVNEQLYPATFTGNNPDVNWDRRDSKTIHLGMSYAAASALITNDTPWGIVYTTTTQKEDGTSVTENVLCDNSEYCILGDITVHPDETVSIKMGKPTDLELALEAALGGDL